MTVPRTVACSLCTNLAQHEEAHASLVGRVPRPWVAVQGWQAQPPSLSFSPMALGEDQDHN